MRARDVSRPRPEHLAAAAQSPLRRAGPPGPGRAAEGPDDAGPVTPAAGLS